MSFALQFMLFYNECRGSNFGYFSGTYNNGAYIWWYFDLEKSCKIHFHILRKLQSDVVENLPFVYFRLKIYTLIRMNHSIPLFYSLYCNLFKICYVMKVTDKKVNVVFPGCYHEYVSVCESRTTNLRLTSKVASSTMEEINTML